jgi:hypothetical protein
MGSQELPSIWFIGRDKASSRDFGISPDTVEIARPFSTRHDGCSIAPSVVGGSEAVCVALARISNLARYVTAALRTIAGAVSPSEIATDPGRTIIVSCATVILMHNIVIELMKV